MVSFHSSGRSKSWIDEVFSSQNDKKFWQVFGVALLLMLSLLSVYNTGVEDKGHREASTSTVSLATSSLSKIEDANDVVAAAKSTGPHHLRQSSPFLLQNVLGIPQGEAAALPSLRDEAANERKFYGGAGDKKHLGGFTVYDKHGVSPTTWDHIITKIGVKSLMDVGCGRGISTSYFQAQGVDVLCVEGSHDGVEQTFLPDPEKQIVEHDYSRGPYWPGKTYDAVWSVEFLEHVGRNYQFNYIQTYRKAALLFVSSSRWGGWHHVEVHSEDWWISKLEMFGFHYSEILTKQIRSVAGDEKNKADKNRELPENLGPDGSPWNAQLIWHNMLVFVNPVVAALPEHAHLLAEPGCYEGRGDKNVIVNRDCTGENESKLPDSYSPLKVTPEQRAVWFSKVKTRIDESKIDESKK